jgi:hypothetical protein
MLAVPLHDLAFEQEHVLGADAAAWLEDAVHDPVGDAVQHDGGAESQPVGGRLESIPYAAVRTPVLLVVVFVVTLLLVEVQLRSPGPAACPHTGVAWVSTREAFL